jgi:hypothetical protein
MKIYTLQYEGDSMPKGEYESTSLRCFECLSEDLDVVFDDPLLWTLCKEAIINEEKIEAFRMRIKTYKCRECGEPVHQVIREAIQFPLFGEGEVPGAS